MRITQGPAHASVTVCNDRIGVASVGGLVLPDANRTISVTAGRVAVDSGARGIVYRMDRAVFAFDLLEHASPLMIDADVRATPSAIVVAECNVQMFDEYCRRAARVGMIRRAFTCPERASVWVREQSALLAASIAFLRDQAPSR